MDEPRRKVTLKRLAAKKAAGTKIIGMEAHDTPTAVMADEIGFDVLCCGSPGPMGMFGHSSMADVDFEEQLYMLQAVLRGAKYAFVLCNMPNTTASVSVERAVENAARIAYLGADGVHIEPSLATIPAIEAITGAGIPVVSHLGVQGERGVFSSGYAPRGRDADDAAAIVELAHACVRAGTVAVLMEHSSEELTRYLWETLPVPVLSLGSGPFADGIFHVSSDIIGCSVFPSPPQRGQFADVWGVMKDAYQAYFDAASGSTYPTPESSFHMRGGEFDRLKNLLATTGTDSAGH
jgi:3-methyl-2-oxobutanoate hydroxymethyltransferase